NAGAHRVVREHPQHGARAGIDRDGDRVERLAPVDLAVVVLVLDRPHEIPPRRDVAQMEVAGGVCEGDVGDRVGERRGANHCPAPRTSPAAGDNTIWRARPVTAAAPPPPPPPPPRDPGISSITSSNSMTASPFHPGTTAPDSGMTRTIWGGVVWGGPPGGSPWRAHAAPPAPSAATTSSPATWACRPMPAAGRAQPGPAPSPG